MQLWWQQFLLIFLTTSVIFCTKTSLISCGVTVCIIDCQCRCVVQFLTERRRPVKSFSAAAVDTIVLWKSAPAHNFSPPASEFSASFATIAYYAGRAKTKASVWCLAVCLSVPFFSNVNAARGQRTFQPSVRAPIHVFYICKLRATYISLYSIIRIISIAIVAHADSISYLLFQFCWKAHQRNSLS